MVTIDQVDLDTDRLRRQVPVYHDFSLPNVWPDERFRVSLTWNNVRAKGDNAGWDFLVEWEDFQPGEVRTVIARQPVQVRYPFPYEDYFRVIFLDQTGRIRDATPENLGQTVQMTVWPGPDSPEYKALEDGREPWEPIVSGGGPPKTVYDQDPEPLTHGYDLDTYDTITFDSQ